MNPLNYLGSAQKVVGHFKQMASEKKWGYFIVDAIVLIAILLCITFGIIAGFRAAFPSKPAPSIATSTTIQATSSSTINNPSLSIQSPSVNNSQIFQNNGSVNVNGSEFTPYLDVAKMNWDGLPYNVTYVGLSYRTSISDTLADYVHLNSSSQIIYTCTSSSAAAYAKVITINPKYPFAYYYLGDCQRINNFPTSTWQANFKSASDIFQFTTQLPDHDPTQDTIYKYIQQFL